MVTVLRTIVEEGAIYICYLGLGKEFNTIFYILQESEALVTETFPSQNLSMFVRESLNGVLERTSTARQRVGKLMSQLVKADVISFPVYLSG
jgi:hypothetical protein